MRARSASAPSVRSRPNQRALSIESASRLDRLSMRSRSLEAVDARARRLRARSRPTSAPRARSAVYMPLRARAANPPSSGCTRRSSIRIGCGLVERALQRLREVVVAEVRGEPHALGELDGPHRLRVVAHEHDERGEADHGAQPVADRVDDLAAGRTTPAASARARGARRAARWRWPSRAAWSIAAARWLSISPMRLRVNAPSAPQSRKTTAICPAARWSVVSTDCIAIVEPRPDRAGDRGADGRAPAPHVAGEQQPGDRREHERAGEAARGGARGDGEDQLEDHEQPDAGAGASASSWCTLWNAANEHERDRGRGHEVARARCAACRR